MPDREAMSESVRRIVGGARTFLRHLAPPADPPLALALFSARARTARPGVMNAYRVRIANVSGAFGIAKLAIDVSAAPLARPPGGPHGYAATIVRVAPGTAATVDVQYDWRDHASFRIEGDEFPADTVRRGTLDSPGLYSVSAVLSSLAGRRLDALEIFQELVA